MSEERAVKGNTEKFRARSKLSVILVWVDGL